VGLEESKLMVERVAKAIYEYHVTLGAVRVWRLDEQPPWDYDPRELTEWERDEYREMARHAITALQTPAPSETFTRLLDGCKGCGRIAVAGPCNEPVCTVCGTGVFK